MTSVMLNAECRMQNADDTCFDVTAWKSLRDVAWRVEVVSV